MGVTAGGFSLVVVVVRNCKVLDHHPCPPPTKNGVILNPDWSKAALEPRAHSTGRVKPPPPDQGVGNSAREVVLTSINDMTSAGKLAAASQPGIPRYEVRGKHAENGKASTTELNTMPWQDKTFVSQTSPSTKVLDLHGYGMFPFLPLGTLLSQPFDLDADAAASGTLLTLRFKLVPVISTSDASF